MKTFQEWNELAQHYARVAFEREMHLRRGVYGFEDLDVLCVFSNNPYRDPQLRERELSEFRNALKNKDVKELGFATFPTTGESAGYSYVMIINAPVALMSQWEDIYDEAVMSQFG